MYTIDDPCQTSINQFLLSFLYYDISYRFLYIITNHNITYPNCTHIHKSTILFGEKINLLA